MHDFLKLHYNCDVYVNIQKEWQIAFWTAVEHRKKSSEIVCCTILILQLSLNVFLIWELSIQYNSEILLLINRFCTSSTQCQQRDDRAFHALSLKHHTNNFAAVESNCMRFCKSLTHILPLKIALKGAIPPSLRTASLPLKIALKGAIPPTLRTTGRDDAHFFALAMSCWPKSCFALSFHSSASRAHSITGSFMMNRGSRGGVRVITSVASWTRNVVVHESISEA